MATPGASILARAADLAAAGRPFVLATVVAVARPTSAKPGARGIIHPDGTIEGWVGGSCAQPTVIAEALRAMAAGEPRLLRLSAEQPTESRRADGIIDLVMTCHSGGTLEIFIEPQVPAPELWVVGVTPIARSLAELGTRAGWQVTAIDPSASGDLFPDGVRVHAARDFAGLDALGSPYVVVASQGQWDEEALVAALGRDVAYVGLVASARRAAAVAEYLELVGVPAERRAALRAPCGLDLGAVGAAEVAVSVLAELVQVRRGRAPFVAMPGPATLAGSAAGSATPATPAKHSAPALAAAPAASPERGAGEEIILVDPVCGMHVNPADVRHIADHEGRTYAFCCAGCRTRFAKNPARYLALA
jgi:xanthine dehydrogenase accessory factor